MNNREQAKITTLKGTLTFMNDNNSKWATVPLITSKFATFKTNLDDTEKKSALAGNDNAGFSEAKKKAKDLFADEAASLCGFAFLEWQTSNVQLAQQCLQAVTDYTSVSDSECGSIGLKMYNLLNDNILLISPDAVSPTDVADLLILLTKFNDTQGSSESVHSTSPVATANFKSALAVSMSDLNSLKSAGKKVRNTEPDFFKNLLAVTKISTVNVHHTHILINVKNKVNLKPLKNVIATFSNSGKTAQSDDIGNIIIDVFPGGTTTVTLTLPGFENYIATLQILSGKDNLFEIQMSPVIVVTP